MELTPASGQRIHLCLKSKALNGLVKLELTAPIQWLPPDPSGTQLYSM